MSGVPQGSVICPTLFLLFVNDVIDIFDNRAVSFKLYADDIKLHSCYNITSSCDDSSVAINRLHCRVLSLSDRRYSLNPLSQTRID